MIIKVKIHPHEWFKKNCYMDQDGDWWRHEELYNLYAKYENDNDKENPHTSYLEARMGTVTDLDLVDFRHWGWAVEKYITKENNPEYYL